MSQNYTEAVTEKYFRCAENDLAVMWYDIENMPEESSSEEWRAEIRKLAQEYSLSSRFALMRILSSRAAGISLSEESPLFFDIKGSSREYHFAQVSMEHAQELSEDKFANEFQDYETLLQEIASQQTDYEPDSAAFLIARAMKDPDTAYTAALQAKEHPELSEKQIRKETKTLLTRAEALKLGHILGFSLEEMEWFLLRVFDYEDGFRYNISSDLIEAYGFLTGAGWKTVAAYQDRYAQIASQIPKSGRESFAEGTQSVEQSLPGLVSVWSVRPDEREYRFFHWMEQQAPYLDIPSWTSLSIYRRLAVFTYHMLTGVRDIPSLTDFADQILNELCEDDSFYEKEMKEALFEKDHISSQKAKKISVELLISNKESFTSAHDPAKAWRTLSINDSADPRVIMAGRPDAGRSRTAKLLEGSLQTEKGDMLHLLWFAFNLIWLREPLDTPCSPQNLYDNLAAFTESCKMVLDKALLPPFYPPHLTEQSMMLSIIASSAEEGTGVPADVYAEICESLIKPRNRQKKE